MTIQSQLGWYGKLPSLGDFASRRLPAGFIEPWDNWLCAGMLDWRTRQPESWLARYLTGPSWRFVLSPGLLDARAPLWIGVLMPSVDRVGRYFPLTVAQPLAQMPKDAAMIENLLEWLKDLDDLALGSLQEDWTADQLDTQLLRLGDWTVAGAFEPSANARALPESNAHESAPAEQESHAELARKIIHLSSLGELQRKAIWLCDEAAGRARLQISQGLPQGQAFSHLWDGHACG
jgi:type VI secretion system protein ImpM